MGNPGGHFLSVLIMDVQMASRVRKALQKGDGHKHVYRMPILRRGKKKTRNPENQITGCVPGAGLEPARHRCHRILNPARLPIPPPRHSFDRDANIRRVQTIEKLFFLPARIIDDRIYPFRIKSESEPEPGTYKYPPAIVGDEILLYSGKYLIKTEL